MNKESRVLVFGIALMFAGLIGFGMSVDGFGRLLFVAGLILAATGAFDIQWSRLWQRVLMFWGTGEFKAAPNEDSTAR